MQFHHQLFSSSTILCGSLVIVIFVKLDLSCHPLIFITTFVNNIVYYEREHSNMIFIFWNYINYSELQSDFHSNKKITNNNKIITNNKILFQKEKGNTLKINKTKAM